jgi:hypothetical protein
VEHASAETLTARDVCLTSAPDLFNCEVRERFTAPDLRGSNAPGRECGRHNDVSIFARFRCKVAANDCAGYIRGHNGAGSDRRLF